MRYGRGPFRGLLRAVGRVLQRDALTAVARHELEEISALVDATRCGDRTTDCLSYFRRLRAIWAMADPASFDWHSVATLATWFMTLVIQRAEHRDTQAIHVKLDELL